MANTCAIIVTFNRLNLLKRCLSSIANQTLPPSNIIVVDNASTDGTEEFCSRNANIQYLKQETNLGGAGGFSRGIKYAFEEGYEYFWIMDDDGVPDNQCLEILSSFTRQGFQYVAPNLLTEDGISHFDTKMKKCPMDYISHMGGPFNGILISRKIVETVGYPMAQFFIWGDEYEYLSRIMEAGFVVITSKKAIHVHKSTAYSYARCPRPYYLVRNSIYIYRLNSVFSSSNGPLLIRTWSIIFRLFFYGFLAGNISQLGYVLKGVFDGIRDNLNSSKEDCCWNGVRNEF